MARLSSDTEYRPSGAPFEFYAGHNRQRQMPEYDFFTDQIISYYAAAHNNLGLALSAQKQAGAAEREYMRALAIQPDLAAAYNNLGSLRFAQGRYQEAEKLFTRVVELSPGRSSGFYNLGLTCKAQHRNNEARDAFMRAWESDRNPDAGNELGLAALNSGNAQAAAAIFNEIIGRYPSHLSAYYNLGLSLMKLGNYKESRKCFEHYLNGVQDPAERREVIEFLNLLHK
jgi:superkiller protein 3